MNITIFTEAKRAKETGIFGFPYFPTRYKNQITDDQYSLLKFSKPDDNFSLKCLAANVTSTSKYISVFPVDCNSKIADSIICVLMLGIWITLNLNGIQIRIFLLYS